MLTIHTRLVHPHPFVTERAAMFYNRVCHFRAKPRPVSLSDKKFRSTRRFCINYQASTRKSQVGAASDFMNKKLLFSPDSPDGKSPDAPLTPFH
jgi:hypothetical protein